MVAELLRAFGNEVSIAFEGQEAISCFHQVLPSVVLLDIGLPDISGYEVARQLRGHGQSQSVPLIALTGYGQMRDKEAAALAGFDAHLVKPAELSDLEAALRG